MLLTNSELLASSVVANAVMNRGRGLSGVNSYARELRFDILVFLERQVREHGQAVWYDVCCGEGHALAEAGVELSEMDWGANIRLIGTDLIDQFAPASSSVEFIATDAAAYLPPAPLHLVTCVHGLHYMGDKLGLLERLYRQMALGGLLKAHLESVNIRSHGAKTIWPLLIRRLRTQGVTLDLHHHVLSITRTEAPLDFGVSYQGASVSAEPNSTGITVIDSWYSIR